MKKFAYLLLTSVFVVACGSKQPKTNKTETSMAGTNQSEIVKAVPSNEFGMWKVANYAGDIGDNKNSLYMTNAITIWGAQRNSASDNSELKVKFLVDKVSFCIKLYENGRTVVRKGDENSYKISIKSAQNEVVEFTAKNPSDRLFINEPDAKKIIELFDKGGKISFSLVSDSKTTPSTYTFTIENPEGFGNAFKKLYE